MSSRVPKSAEAEQKVACIALQGLCMVDSQSGYYPEGNLKQIKNAESLFKGISEVDVTLVSRCTLDASSHFLSPTRLKKYEGFKYHELFNIVFFIFFLSFFAACFTVPGPGDASFVSFKSSLHDFCQKYKLPPPQYITNQGTHGYSAKLKFGGLFFQSSSHFTARIEAEQHAAFEALQGLGLLESSVEFESAKLNNGVNTSGVIIGGGASVNGGSTTNISVGQSSRQHTRTAGSRANSRPPSRPGSRPASRQGSMNQLNITNQSFDQRDISYNSINTSSRSYSTSAATTMGYDAQYGLNRHEQNTDTPQQHTLTYQRQHSRNGSIGGHSAVSLTSTPRHHHQQQQFSATTNLENEQAAVTGYDEGSDVYAFSYSNYNGSGTVPRNRSQSYQDYDDADFSDGGAVSSSSFSTNMSGGGKFTSSHSNNHPMMYYEHNSRASSGYATMPHKPTTSNGTTSSQVCELVFT